MRFLKLFPLLLIASLSWAQTNVEKTLLFGADDYMDRMRSTYLMFDEFSDTRAAGSVNGTLATDGVSLRAIVDGNSVMSFSGGSVSFATGGSAAGNPGLWYPLRARTAGDMLFARLTLAGTTNAAVEVGWDGNQAGALTNGLQFAASGAINSVDNAGTAVARGVYTATTYDVMVGTRATGTWGFIKGGAFTYWTLLYLGSAGTANSYPGISALGTSAVATVPWFRVPRTQWSPPALVGDGFATTFGTTDGLATPEGGGAGKTWTHGGTRAVANGKAVNTPTIGAEMAANISFETWSSTTNAGTWTEGHSASGVVSQDSTYPHSGAYSMRLEGPGTEYAYAYQLYGQLPLGTWYSGSYWARSQSGTRTVVRDPNGVVNAAVPATYTQFLFTCRGTTATATNSFGFTASAGAESLYVDDVSLKRINESTLYSTTDVAPTSDYLVSADLKVSAGTQAGLVVSYVDTNNLVLAYHDGTNANLDKCVAGTWTSIVSAASTYVANATIRVIKDRASYSLFYANSKVGATATISDSILVASCKVGLFSTSSADSLDNFVVYSRGNDNSYSILDRWAQP